MYTVFNIFLSFANIQSFLTTHEHPTCNWLFEKHGSDVSVSLSMRSKNIFVCNIKISICQEWCILLSHDLGDQPQLIYVRAHNQIDIWVGGYFSVIFLNL